jgi:acetate kinase
MEKENLNTKQASDLINRKSGMIGISGISSDMRDIEEAADKGNKRARMALDMYDYRVKKYIGAYAAAMGGVDLIIFTGGIGENAVGTRKGVIKGLEFLGIDFNYELNCCTRGKDVLLTHKDSKVKVMAITTNEELVIANEAMITMSSQ